MTFEQYLKNKYKSKYEDYQSFDIYQEVEIWHANELKSMRTKGANTTNSKYSKEERSEWAKKGGRPRKPVNNSLTK
jgi:hypothetical protein